MSAGRPQACEPGQGAGQSSVEPGLDPPEVRVGSGLCPRPDSEEVNCHSKLLAVSHVVSDSCNIPPGVGPGVKRTASHFLPVRGEAHRSDPAAGLRQCALGPGSPRCPPGNSMS